MIASPREVIEKEVNWSSCLVEVFRKPSILKRVSFFSSLIPFKPEMQCLTLTLGSGIRLIKPFFLKK